MSSDQQRNIEHELDGWGASRSAGTAAGLPGGFAASVRAERRSRRARTAALVSAVPLVIGGVWLITSTGPNVRSPEPGGLDEQIVEGVRTIDELQLAPRRPTAMALLRANASGHTDGHDPMDDAWSLHWAVDPAQDL